ncbi:MAG: PEGA domain-containing protein [Myxococcaceae bacterium]|nr:PEGA domain-containing protein [Myxococcaceae bacterium]
MKKTFAPILAAVVLCSTLVLAQEKEAPKVAVVPFAALSGDVPQRAGTKAAGMLSNELKNADGFALIGDATKASAPHEDPYKDALEQARAAVEEAQDLRAKRKFRAAEEALHKALAAYEKGAPGLTDVGEYQDAWVLLSAIQYLTGRDEDGARSLDTALALAPNRELPLAKTSALFTRVVNDARAALMKGNKGTLLVESSPMGAAVTVDGVALGSTPLQVNDVPPGVHVWRVQLPSGEAIGGVARIEAKKTVKVLGQATGQDPESKMLATLSQNRLDQGVIDAAKQYAQAAQADLLIFGALSREGKNLALDSFVLETKSGALKRLPRSTFDTELLSAGMEFYNLVGSLAKEGLKVGTDTRVPGPVSNEFKGGGVKIAEVRYGQLPKAAESADLLGVDTAAGDKGGTAQKEERKPLTPKKRTPLKRAN